MVNLWWLSFADPQLPEGKQFLGACIVPGRDIGEATQCAWFLKINPGGEVRGQPFTDKVFASFKKIQTKWMNRLLTKEECGEFDEELIALLEQDNGKEKSH